MQTKKHDDFFAGINQANFEWEGFKGKIPTFYRRIRAYTAVFPASIFSLRRLMPDKSYVPAQIFPGIGQIALTCNEFYETDIGPYNEFIFSVSLNNPHILQLPIYNSLRQLMQSSFYAYFHSMPVTSENALRTGIDFAGFPKFLAAIDFTDTPEWIICEVKEGNDLICRIKGRKIAAKQSRIVNHFIRLYQNQQPQSIESKVNACQLGISRRSADVEIELGTQHPLADTLAQTLLSKRAQMYSYMPDAQCVLYGPDRFSLPFIIALLQGGNAEAAQYGAGKELIDRIEVRSQSNQNIGGLRPSVTPQQEKGRNV